MERKLQTKGKEEMKQVAREKIVHDSLARQLNLYVLVMESLFEVYLYLTL